MTRNQCWPDFVCLGNVHTSPLSVYMVYGLDHKTVDGSLDRVAGQFKQFKV